MASSRCRALRMCCAGPSSGSAVSRVPTAHPNTKATDTSTHVVIHHIVPPYFSDWDCDGPCSQSGLSAMTPAGASAVALEAVVMLRSEQAVSTAAPMRSSGIRIAFMLVLQLARATSHPHERGDFGQA